MSAGREKGYCWFTRAGNVGIFQFYHSLMAIDIDSFMENEWFLSSGFCSKGD